LPIRHVAIYRNGVAYIERSGNVAAGEVRFHMKESDVGDFLATVAVAGPGGSSVRAAAVPTEKDLPDKDAVQTVALSVANPLNDLDVGYITQSPVWKPSYRLVVKDHGASDFQVWGLVQNLSGEDWRDVHLSLIAGAPIAFSSQLQTPVIPTRPSFTDHGETIGAVPPSETTYSQAQPAPKPVLIQDSSVTVSSTPSKVSPTARLQAGRSVPRVDAGGGGGGSAASPAPRPAAAPAAGRPAGNKSSDDLLSLMSAASGGGASASASPTPTTGVPATASPAAKPAAPAPVETVPPEYFGASTRYDVRQPVTIANDNTSMVLILSHPVRSEEVLLFAPNAGIPSSAEHPFRAIRFVNDTGGELEPGSLAMFEKGVFVGQALLEPVPSGASATLPFALDRGMSIESEKKTDAPSIGEERLARIAGGKLSIQMDRSVRTIYHLHNGGDATRVLVRHGLASGTSLHSPPAGTEERMGTALVPVAVGSHNTAELVVDERSGQPVVTDWFSEGAGYAVRAYLKDPKSDPDAVRKLAAAWAVRDEVVQRTVERDHLRQQAYDLKQESEELRRNMWASVVSTDALRAKVGNHLTQVLAQLADDEKKIVTLDSDIGDLTVKFKHAVQDIDITP
jgi:hypothetical protein